MDVLPVTLLQDDSCHWYVVPSVKSESFRKLSERIMNDEEDYDAINEFNDKFSKYMTGGDVNNVQLYISYEDEK